VDGWTRVSVYDTDNLVTLPAGNGKHCYPLVLWFGCGCFVGVFADYAGDFFFEVGFGVVHIAEPAYPLVSE